MIVVKNKSECCGCTACESICPVNAIEMIYDEEGFKYPYVNENKCIDCGLCNKVCPILNSKEVVCDHYAYACYNKDEIERENSSSGGIFSLIAKEILYRKGVVCGATLDEDFNVKHICIDDESNLWKLRTSKYVQSDIGKVYFEIKNYLNDGRYVLFTGTPCQTEGLLLYLGRKYDRLYVQDIICHGVPSKLVWEKYKEYRQSIERKKPIKVNFRNKDDGWKLFNMKFTYADKVYKNSSKKDLYMKTFLNNISLRESCYKCNFKKENRNADITLADFWGIEKILPEMDDDKGTSLVIVNSPKGKELFESIDAKIIKKEISFADALKYNSAMTNSVSRNSKRDAFFKDLNKISFDKVVNRYIKSKPSYKKIISKVRNKLINNRSCINGKNKN